MGRFFGTLMRSFEEFGKDRVPRLAAALSYYTIFAIAPILILIIAIVGFIYGSEEARAQLVGQLSEAVGPEAANLVAGMIEQTAEGGTGVFATVISIVTILVGATGVTAQLQMALNDIWKVPQAERQGLWHTVKLRLRGLLMVLGIGLIAIFSFALQTAVNIVVANFEGLLPIPDWLLWILNQVVTVALITAAIALLFRYLSDADMEWRDVWPGAILTGILIKVGEIALGIYLGTSGVGSAFGAAGSLVVLLLFIYYSAQILFFGAEFTYVVASRNREESGETREGGSSGREQPGR